MNTKPANGTKGCLLSVEGTFRVYDKKDKTKFKDYDIHHCDLQAIIDDLDSAFYEDTEVLDHSPETLGYK